MKARINLRVRAPQRSAPHQGTPGAVAEEHLDSWVDPPEAALYPGLALYTALAGGFCAEALAQHWALYHPHARGMTVTLELDLPHPEGEPAAVAGEA
jgi:hypothetical protein